MAKASCSSKCSDSAPRHSFVFSHALINATYLTIIGVHDGGIPQLNYGSLLTNIRKYFPELPSFKNKVA